MKKIKQNTNAELMKWIWSYNEQLILLDRHDAYWIEQAKLGWKDKDAFRSFLSTYGLFRGKAGKFLSKHQTKFINVCNDYFSKPLRVGDFAGAQALWEGAVAELRGKKSNADDVSFWSATLKAFWFYHPDKLPMYDKYARIALEQLRVNNDFLLDDSLLLPKRSVRPENFLLVFDKFYNQYAKDKIKQSKQYVHRDYKYKYRVADKYLWLHGFGAVTGSTTRTIDTYKLSLKMAPQKLI